MVADVPAKEHRPKHVAVIMDGNGRWALDRGLSRLEGHRRGADVVREITTYCRELEVSHLTLFSFSTENWRRPPDEIAGLMVLLEEYCERERPTLMRHEISLKLIGSSERLPPTTRAALENLIAATRHNGRMTLTLAVDYGSRDELVKAVSKLVERGDPKVDEDMLAACLDTAGMPEPDLLIRTSGEMRLSNFMLWQMAYAELYFPQVRWPDFTRQDFAQALWEYANRQRRFGHTGEQVDRL